MGAMAGRWGRFGLLVAVALSVSLLSGRPVWAESLSLAFLLLLLPLLALRLGEGQVPPGRGWLLAAGLMALAALIQLVPLPPGLISTLSPQTAVNLETAYPGWPEAGPDFAAVRARLVDSEPEPSALRSPAPGETELLSVDQILREAGLRADEEERAPEAAGADFEPPPPVPDAELQAGAWRPLSLAPARSLPALLKLLVLAAAFLLAGSTLRAPSRAYPFCRWLTAIGVAVALVAILQIVRDLPNPMAWLGGPIDGGLVRTFGPFPNKNHLAGFLALLLPVAVTLVLSRAQSPPMRILWSGGVLVLGLGILAARSRGGLVAAAVGVGVLSLGLLARPGKRAYGAALLAATAGCVAAAIVWVPRAVSQSIGDLVETRPVEELRWLIWGDVVGMVRDFPVAGAGLDAFVSLFPAYKSFPDPLRFTHVENDYLQFLAEMGLIGLPALLLALGLWAYGFQKAVRSGSAPVLALGAWSGVAAMGVHGLLDFNFHVTSNALAFLIVLAVAVGSTPRSRRDPAARSRLRRGVLLAASILVLVSGLLWLVPRGRSDLLLRMSWTAEQNGRWEDAMALAGGAARLDPRNTGAAWRLAGMRRTSAGLDAGSRDEWYRASLEPAARGLLAAPTLSYLHREVGLAFQGRSIWSEAAGWFRRGLAFAPEDALGREFLGDALRQKGESAEAVRAYAAATEHLPPVRTHETFRRLAAKAVETTTDAGELSPMVRSHPVRALYLAEILADAGESGQAAAMGEEILATWNEDPEVARRVFELGRRAGETELCWKAVDRWQGLAPEDPGPLRMRAVLHQARGDREEAVAAAARAVDLAPGDANSHIVLVDILRNQGRIEEALEAARVGSQRAPGDPRLRKLVQDLQGLKYRIHRQEVDDILRGRR